MNDMDNYRENFINNLKRIRFSYRMTQEQFAEAIGISDSTYKKIERNLMPPSISFLVKLSNFTNIPIDCFFYEENEMDKIWSLVENMKESDQLVIVVRIANKIGKNKVCEIIGEDKGAIE